MDNLYETSSEAKKRYLESLPIDRIEAFVTARGSVYSVLPDGRTQRFKTLTGELNEPQDLIVFVPDLETIKKVAPPDQLHRYGENEVEYQQILLENIKKKGSKNIVADSKGRKIEQNSQLHSSQENAWLHINAADQKNALVVPVSKTPKFGYYTYDTRKFTDEDGETYRERHLGNKVVEIREKS